MTQAITLLVGTQSDVAAGIRLRQKFPDSHKGRRVLWYLNFVMIGINLLLVSAVWASLSWFFVASFSVETSYDLRMGMAYVVSTITLIVAGIYHSLLGPITAQFETANSRYVQMYSQVISLADQIALLSDEKRPTANEWGARPRGGIVGDMDVIADGINVLFGPPGCSRTGQYAKPKESSPFSDLAQRTRDVMGKLQTTKGIEPHEFSGLYVELREVEKQFRLMDVAALSSPPRIYTGFRIFSVVLYLAVMPIAYLAYMRWQTLLFLYPLTTLVLAGFFAMGLWGSLREQSDFPHHDIAAWAEGLKKKQ